MSVQYNGLVTSLLQEGCQHWMTINSLTMALVIQARYIEVDGRGLLGTERYVPIISTSKQVTIEMYMSNRPFSSGGQK